MVVARHRMMVSLVVTDQVSGFRHRADLETEDCDMPGAIGRIVGEFCVRQGIADSDVDVTLCFRY